MGALTEIKGIGPVLAKACTDKGYRSVKKIAAAVVAELVVVPGISEARAKTLIAAAKSLHEGSPKAKAAVAGDAAKINSGGKKKPAKKSSPKKKSAKAEKSRNVKKDKKPKKAKKTGKKKSLGKGGKKSGRKK